MLRIANDSLECIGSKESQLAAFVLPADGDYRSWRARLYIDDWWW
jgi:hypothetical protein